MIQRATRGIKRAAARNEFRNYKDVANLVGLPTRGNYMAWKIGGILGEISEEMHSQGFPMLSAIVVRRDTGMPGEGFFTLAIRLGKLHRGASVRAKQRFWRNEVRAVFATW